MMQTEVAKTAAGKGAAGAAPLRRHDFMQRLQFYSRRRVLLLLLVCVCVCPSAIYLELVLGLGHYYISTSLFLILVGVLFSVYFLVSFITLNHGILSFLNLKAK